MLENAELPSESLEASTAAATADAEQAASSAYAASIDAEIAGAAASQQADDANIAAAAATGAAIAQGQIIDIVTQAAREDAQRARNQAESAAAKAGEQAELASTIAEYTLQEVSKMLSEHSDRITALEARPTETNNVAMIGPDPGRTEGEARNESMGGEEKSSSKRPHGRKRR